MFFYIKCLKCYLLSRILDFVESFEIKFSHKAILLMNDLLILQPTIHELKTPLAFSIVTHSHLGLLEAQLATTFRPNNAYCIFVDSKAIHTFKSAAQCVRVDLNKMYGS